MSNTRADCDLSASWGSEDANAGPVGNFSSDEETHVLQYRDFVRQEELALECHKRQKHRADEEEDERAVSGEGMACKYCTVGLACARCEAAKRKRRQQDEEDVRPYMTPKPVQSGLPKLTLRTSGLVKEMLKTETPMPGQISVGDTLSLANKHPTTVKTHTNAPRKLPPLRYYTTAELEAKQLAQSAKLQLKTPTPKQPMAELVFYDDIKKTNALPPMLNVSTGVTQSAKPSDIQYTNKTLSQLASRPKGATINLDGERVDRMATQLKFASQASGQAMQSMLMGQTFKPLECNTGGANATEEIRNVKCHLRSCHSLYFQLLEENGLMAEATDVHKADPTISFIFVVPNEKALKQISTRHSDETRHLMAYHVIKVPTGMTLQVIRDRAVFPTLLADKDIDVEFREGDHYVGGHRLVPDTNYPAYIGHIRALLDDSASNGPAPEDANDDGTVDEMELPPPSYPPPEYRPDDEATTMELTHSQNLLRAVNEDTLFTRPFKPLVKKMGMSYYKGSTDLSEHYNAVLSALPVTLTVRVYRTQPLFELYRKGQLADLSRVRAHSHAEFKFDGKDQLKWEDGLQMHEYSLQTTSQLRRADLADGLVELRFGDPLHENHETTLLCKMDCSALKNDPAVCTYMTDNENVLLRFANGVLSTVLVNHASSLPYKQTDARGKDHFFELFISEHARERFVSGMNRLTFDKLVLQEGTLSKYTKKAKRYVTKKTRDTLQKGKAMKDSALALKLVAVRKPEGLMALFAQPKGASAGDKRVQVRIYDRKMKARDAESLSDVLALKYTDPIVWYQVTGDNQLYDTLQRTDNYYVHLDVDQWRGLKFNANAVTAGSQLYFADGAGEDVYVLAFDDHALMAIAKISRHSAYYKQMK